MGSTGFWPFTANFYLVGLVFGYAVMAHTRNYYLSAGCTIHGWYHHLEKALF